MGILIKAEEFAKLRNLKLRKKSLILATGVFDILHIEHIRFLKKAKMRGDILIVGLESDERVRHSKGEGRPVNSQDDRAELLTAIGFIDYVFVLPNNLDTVEGRENLIEMLSPDIYAVSQSSPYLSEKRRVMKKFGGKVVVVHKYNPKISTTVILEKIKN